LFLKTAIDFLRRGKIAIREHRDPYGDGPFELTPFDGGFELASKLVYGKRRIRQAFGQKIND
jgi:hypothetical protein